jgi:ABC-type dipeptide/oligopeptide/nickel transport system permease subunit
MATVAQPKASPYAGENWVIPHDKPWYVKLGRVARENPIGALSFLLVLGFIALGIFGPYLSPYDPKEIDATQQFIAPGTAHLFGTDQLGHDMFSRVIAGARIDLKFGAVILVFGFVPGTLLGILSGYFGRWVDYLIQRSGEAWTAFPQLFLLLTFIAALGPGLRTAELVIAISAIFSGSRIMRVVALVEKQKEYIIGARATGASEFRLLWRHVIPNIMPFILVGFSSVFAVAVLAESLLSFLGIGVSPGEPSWGADLSSNLGRGSQYTWLVIYPGLAISIVVLSFNLLGDTLRDILDPRLRGSTGGRK